jgi:hypothetical protein
MQLMGRASVDIHDENDGCASLFFLRIVSSFSAPIEGNLHDLSYLELYMGSTQPTFLWPE